MAGMSTPGEGEDNPVNINVIPMVDVIFCLCLFFMCSFKFKQLAGKMDSWLPQDKGLSQGNPQTDALEEIRVMLTWDGSRTIHQLGGRMVTDEAELEQLIYATWDDYRKVGKLDSPVVIDARPDVPWKDVVTVMNLCKRNDIEKIEFSFAPSGKFGPQEEAGAAGGAGR